MAVDEITIQGVAIIPSQTTTTISFEDFEEGFTTWTNIVLNKSQPNFLLQNNNGTFEDIASTIGLDYLGGRGRGSLWFDYNDDGLLDVILGNAIRPDRDTPTALFVQEKNSFKIFFKFKNLKGGYPQIAELFSNGTSHLLFLNPSSEAVFTTHDFPFVNILEHLNFLNYPSSDFVI